MIKITKSALIAFIAAFVLMFISTALAHAQEEHGEEEAKKLGITFPIADLGNCDSVSACKSYCDNESNREVCTSFAKKKGFYKERPQNSELVNKAKSDLGCDSESSCRAFCENEANAEKCSAFAQKHGLGGPRGNPGDGAILQKAKEILGCDSPQSCQAVCEDPANQQKCSDFAKASGLGGGIKMEGPGGCNSEESCKAYCEANPQECGGQAGQGSRQFQEGEFSGPNMSPEEFCKQNPDKCQGSGNFGQPPPEDYKPPEGFSPDQYPSSQPTEQKFEYPTPSYSTPTSTEVKGVSTGGLLQQLLNWLGF